LILKFERVPIKRCTSGQVLDEQDHRFDLVNHCFHLFFLCRVITESMRVRESCTSPLVHAEARLCSTSNSVAQKEGQNFSHLALFAGVFRKQARCSSPLMRYRSRRVSPLIGLTRIWIVLQQLLQIFAFQPLLQPFFQ